MVMLERHIYCFCQSVLRVTKQVLEKLHNHLQGVMDINCIMVVAVQ